jgi:hypothetical protein
VPTLARAAQAVHESVASKAKATSDKVSQVQAKIEQEVRRTAPHSVPRAPRRSLTRRTPQTQETREQLEARLKAAETRREV